MKAVSRLVSKRDLRRVARKALGALAASKKRAALVFLKGDLGAGKTSFVQALAKILGIRGKVLSPTFVFIREHPIRNSPRFKTLVHVDAYRIETRRDFRAIGLQSYLKGPAHLVVVEWPERAKRWLPKPDVSIAFKHHSPSKREVRIRS